MNETITTAAELDALPNESVWRDANGNIGFRQEPGFLVPIGGGPLQWNTAEAVIISARLGDRLPLTVLYRPDAEPARTDDGCAWSLGPDDLEGFCGESVSRPGAELCAYHEGYGAGMDDAISELARTEPTRDDLIAVLPPQRCAPSEEEIAHDLHASSGDLVGMNFADIGTWFQEKYLRQAGSLRRMLASQPTVEEAKAQAVAEFVEKVKVGLAAEFERDGEPYSTAILDQIASEYRSEADHG